MAQRKTDDHGGPSQQATRGRGAATARRSTDSKSSTDSTASKVSSQPTGIVSNIGPLQIDWPRSFGYFGGVGLAVAVGVIDPPVGLFIAAVPFVKMLDLPGASQVLKFIGQVFEGVAKPVGGDGQGTVRLVTANSGADSEPVGQA